MRGPPSTMKNRRAEKERRKYVPAVWSSTRLVSEAVQELTKGEKWWMWGRGDDGCREDGEDDGYRGGREKGIKSVCRSDWMKSCSLRDYVRVCFSRLNTRTHRQTFVEGTDGWKKINAHKFHNQTNGFLLFTPPPTARTTEIILWNIFRCCCCCSKKHE